MLRRITVLAALAACGADDEAPGGPDAPIVSPVDANDGLDIAAVPAGCVEGRAETDRPDDTVHDQIRVLYVIPSDLPDLARDTSGVICNSVRAWTTWFHARTDRFLRIDTSNGLVDIGFVRLEQTDMVMRGNDPSNQNVATGIAFVRNRIELELERRGMIAENKLYAVYYEGSSTYACGGGSYPPQIPDRVNAMYLRGMPPGQSSFCADIRPWGRPDLRPDYIDYGMLHEIVHGMGIVPDDAPNEQSFGHVFDLGAPEPARDLMYSPRPGMPDAYWAIDHPEGLLVDIGSDDYYGAPTSVDLETMSLLAPLSSDARRPIGW